MAFAIACIDYDVTSRANNWILSKGAYVRHMPSINPPYIPIKLDRERMDRAINANRVRMPKGLAREQRHQFLLERAKQLQNLST